MVLKLDEKRVILDLAQEIVSMSQQRSAEVCSGGAGQGEGVDGRFTDEDRDEADGFHNVMSWMVKSKRRWTWWTNSVREGWREEVPLVGRGIF